MDVLGTVLVVLLWNYKHIASASPRLQVNERNMTCVRGDPFFIPFVHVHCCCRPRYFAVPCRTWRAIPSQTWSPPNLRSPRRERLAGSFGGLFGEVFIYCVEGLVSDHLHWLRRLFANASTKCIQIHTQVDDHCSRPSIDPGPYICSSKWKLY